MFIYSQNYSSCKVYFKPLYTKINIPTLTLQMADNYQVMSRYSRKTYKKRREPQDSETSSPRDDNCENTELPRYNTYTATIGPSTNKQDSQETEEASACRCDIDADANLANLLHKKCPVITLARRQLQRLQNESEAMFYCNSRCCRSLFDIICLCKEFLLNITTNRSQCVLIILIIVAFFSGLVLGAASCGSRLGHFNSPILTCIDNFFMPDTYSAIENTFRSVV